VNDERPCTAVLLPGTGSDDVFVRAVFAAPLAARRIAVVTPAPRPGPELARAHLAALDAAAADGPVLAGGISFGAHLAAAWAVANPARCAGLLLALPGWHGEAGDAPAALAARYSAAQVRAAGLPAALDAATRDVPGWLAAELTRAWSRYGPALPESLELAAGWPAPTLADLATITVPVGVAACPDDPVHPLDAARSWARAIPGAVLATTTLTALGEDRTALGAAAVGAWSAALGDGEGAA
jgi:pimeloyl-ACP methyl ester carboxylesterase